MKKFGTLLVALLLSISLLIPASASACAIDASIYEIRCVAQYNFRLYMQKLLEEAGYEIVRTANLRIEEIIEESCAAAEVATSECQINAIINSMISRTNAVSKSAQASAAACGVKTVCDYVEVEIGGRTVLVDPLRVVLV